MHDDKTDNKDTQTPSGTLSDRIAQFESRKVDKQQATKRAQMPTQGMALAGRVAIELVAGVAVGVFIGWVLDGWLGTTPLFLVVMFFLGAAAGMLNVWRLATGRGLAAGYFDEHAGKDNSQQEDRSG